jgi:hypothetical protein
MKWEPEIPRWRQVYAVMSERIVDGTYETDEQREEYWRLLAELDRVPRGDVTTAA